MYPNIEEISLNDSLSLDLSNHCDQLVDTSFYNKDEGEVPENISIECYRTADKNLCDIELHVAKTPMLQFLDDSTDLTIYCDELVDVSCNEVEKVKQEKISTEFNHSINKNDCDIESFDGSIDLTDYCDRQILDVSCSKDEEVTPENTSTECDITIAKKNCDIRPRGRKKSMLKFLDNFFGGLSEESVRPSLSDAVQEHSPIEKCRSQPLMNNNYNSLNGSSRRVVRKGLSDSCLGGSSRCGQSPPQNDRVGQMRNIYKKGNSQKSFVESNISKRGSGMASLIKEGAKVTNDVRTKLYQSEEALFQAHRLC